MDRSKPMSDYLICAICGANINLTEADEVTLIAPESYGKSTMLTRPNAICGNCLEKFTVDQIKTMLYEKGEDKE